MLNIVIYVNMNCMYSSREIEKVCIRYIKFMYLLDRASAPDYSTTKRIRSIDFSIILYTYIIERIMIK
ncbi:MULTISPECIES: transposase [Romboutsia]|uniref:transposase n=1 Tax=Romboutsia TaxID=1501226 RepID=UPI0014135C6C|nr:MULTISPECIES: transposase [Romboutsia]MDB8792711.1 transposase [Romboutsia sp. 1001216sp1]MDB8799297.1 transposase [Romboutsia sp. 1001216sp1]